MLFHIPALQNTTHPYHCIFSVSILNSYLQSIIYYNAQLLVTPCVNQLSRPREESVSRQRNLIRQYRVLPRPQCSLPPSASSTNKRYPALHRCGSQIRWIYGSRECCGGLPKCDSPCDLASRCHEPMTRYAYILPATIDHGCFHTQIA